MNDAIQPQQDTQNGVSAPSQPGLHKSTHNSPLRRWLFNPDRAALLRWSTGFFTIGTIITLIVALRYFFAYQFPTQPLGIAYTIAAFTSHFASILIILWVVPVILLTVLFPFRKLIIPLSIIIVSIVITLVLLDSQLFTTNRFHFTFLTIRIFGIKTWGFGVFYLLMSIAFNSFVAKFVWDHFVVQKKKLHCAVSIPVTIVLLLFTHGTHIWADAVGYVPVTSFTSTLPLFYPSTDKKQMMKMGIIDISNRRGMPKGATKVSDFYYPLAPLSFTPDSQPNNILIILSDCMRPDIMTPECAPECMKWAQSGIQYTNHWSGGNSTKMGCFSLFYGIPPTYEQYVESNKISPLLIDRMLDANYNMGIFTSYRLYTPACLDITAFVKVPGLRLETKIPGPVASWRNDSAATEEWKGWLDTIDSGKPFFGFLFYDALMHEKYPPSYENRLVHDKNATEQQIQYAKYKLSMMRVDSLIGSVVADLDKRKLLEKTIVIITGDHGVEYDDNKLGFVGHGSAYSDYQVRVPLIVLWPGKAPGINNKRTGHNDICMTLMKNALGCTNKESDYSSGNDLFSDSQWDYHLVASYYNFAIIEPQQVTIQFPAGYYECRDHKYQILPKTVVSPNLAKAFQEMGRFHHK